MVLADIIGPVMVGPSSSHTAGAVKIGNVARKLMGENIIRARILFHGSFQQTGKGHGTDKAIVAGLLGFSVDDERIPKSFTYAKQSKMKYSFGKIDLGEEAHPNSVKLLLEGENEKKLEVVSSSIVGGQIRIVALDGLATNFSGDVPTLIVHNVDQPGHVAEVTSMMEKNKVNIASMELYRSRRGGNAVMVLECDQEVPKQAIDSLKNLEGIVKVTYLSMKPEETKEEKTDV